MVKSDLDPTFRESFSADLHTTAHLFLCGCGVEHKPTSAEPKQLRQRYVLPDGTTTGGGTKSIRLVNFVKNPHFNCTRASDQFFFYYLQLDSTTWTVKKTRYRNKNALFYFFKKVHFGM